MIQNSSEINMEFSGFFEFSKKNNVPMISIRIIKQYLQIFYETVKLWTFYVGESENQK